MLNRRSFISALMASAALGASRVHAATSDEAVTLVRQITSEVLALITSAGSRAAKEAAFRGILERHADIRQVAGSALGRYRRAMPAELRASYVDAYTDFVARTYVKRFDDYNGENIDVVGVRDLGQGRHLVDTQIKRTGELGLAVSWRVERSRGSGQLVINDLYVENISMLLSQRDEFESMINSRSGNFQAFIADLRAR